MLLTIGILAGTTWRARWGYSAIAFGAWDILYYAFLRMMTGWPQSLFDWDVLFLIPLPWGDRCWRRCRSRYLMIVWGTIVTEAPDITDAPVAVRRRAWTLNATGIALALYIFMADSLQQLPRLKNGMAFLLPTQFNWLLFCAALVLMSTPLFTIRRPTWGRLMTGWRSSRA